MNRKRVGIAMLVLALALSAAVHFWLFRRTSEIRLFRDSYDYLEISRQSIFSKAFWTTNWDRMTMSRPPLTPIVYKLLRQNISAISVIQTIVSAASWFLLACVCAFSVERLWLRILAALCVLAFSLSDSIVLWNKVILSESFSLSILACLVAAWLLLLRRRTRWRVACVVIASILYALVRDSNAYMGLAIAGILGLLIGAGTVKTGRSGFALISFALLFSFIVSGATAGVGSRWLPPFLNVITFRILPFPEHARFFQERGMPVSEALLNYKGKAALDDGAALYRADEFGDFRAWTRRDGVRTYLRFLVRRPAYLLYGPTMNLPRLIFSDLAAYAPADYSGLIHGKVVNFLFRDALFPLYVFAAGCLVGLGVLLAYIRQDATFIVPVAMLALVLPHALIAWHGDAAEVQRHALQASAQAKVGFILLGLLFCNLAWGIWGEKDLLESFKRADVERRAAANLKT